MINDLKLVILEQTEASSWHGLEGRQVLMQHDELLALVEKNRIVLQEFMRSIRSIAFGKFKELNEVLIELDLLSQKLKNGV